MVADIHTADLSPRYVDTLDKLQVRANLVVPILKEKYLWGLLCVHHCQTSRLWSSEDISLVKKVVKKLLTLKNCCSRPLCMSIVDKLYHIMVLVMYMILSIP